MKIGILHFSDLHIDSSDVNKKLDLIHQSCYCDLKDISNLYFVFSGDIVKHGKKEEYINAAYFIKELKRNLKPSAMITPVKVIMVPGNHDCCFEKVKTTRKTLLENSNYEIILDKDLYNDILAVQDNYWDFYNDVIGNIPDNKVSYKIDDIISIKSKISFHCYNSSWMSAEDEKVGSLIMPENNFIDNEIGEIVISVFHHPLNWFSPNTSNNNKMKFEEHLIETSNILMYGHEHGSGISKCIYQDGNNILYSEGKAFKKENFTDTGFGYIELNLENFNVKSKIFNWSSNKYICIKEDEYFLSKKEKREFILNNTFEEKLNILDIPLQHSKKNKLTSSDVFVFPDLEPIIQKDESVKYPNSSELISLVKNEKKTYSIIQGEEQSGKTTLFNIMFKKLYDAGFYPIYIKGKNIKTTKVKDIINKVFKDQYENGEISHYLKNSKKVLFIDNLHKSTLNSKYRIILIENICKSFNYVFISVSNSVTYNYVTEEGTTLKDFLKYKILPLGHEKRGEIIEKWIKIGTNKMTIEDSEILTNMKSRIQEINTLLGNKLMPSYPIFILTLLQGLDSQIFSQDYSSTAYGNCYQALITVSLVKFVSKDQINSMFNILKELAFYLFENKLDCFSSTDFNLFFEIYRNQYYTDGTEKSIIKLLLDANIIKEDDEFYYFSYKYIFFYLVADKISSKIDDYTYLIEDLCKTIHIERNANILIFISHHSKAQILIESIVFTSMLPFEDVDPITLDKDDKLSTFIQGFVKEIKQDIIEEKNPQNEVKNNLRLKDKNDRNLNYEIEEDNMPPEAIEMSQAFRTIKILGQIVKNQKGDFEKEKLEELVEAAYNVCFRFIGFFSNILKQDRDQIVELIHSELEEKGKKFDTKLTDKTVTKFLQFISWRLCIDSMTNLMFAVGTKGRDVLFDTVSNKIGTSASKIVTFAIKSYYGKIKIPELKNLLQETKENYIAQSILRVYIKKYLYTNYVEKSKKDRIIELTGFKPQSINNRKISKLSS